MVAILPGFSQPSELPRKNITFSMLPDHLGLSQTSVNAILQDRRGFLWIATWSGLIRYDGYNTKIFHSGTGADELQSNLISTLFEDHHGVLWIGSQFSGLFRYDPRTERFTNFRYTANAENSISNNNIWKVVEDDNHNLWVATEGGLNLYDRKSERFTVFRNSKMDASSLSDDFVTDLYFDSSGSLWVATNFGLNKLLKVDGPMATFQRFIDPNADAANNFVYQVIEVRVEGKREMWFITKKGLKVLENDRITSFTPSERSPNHSLFRSLLLIENDTPYLLLGSAVDISLFNLAERKFSKHLQMAINNPEGSSSMAATALYLDKGGVLWVGTKKGLYKYDSYSEDFSYTLTRTFDETNSIITGIEESRSGYWISTIGGGLFHLDDSKIRPVAVRTGSKTEFAPFVQSLLVDKQGGIWLATAGAGIIHVEEADYLSDGTPTAKHHFHTKSTPAINDDYIMSLAEDKHGHIWAGTWDGHLIRIKDHVVQQYDKKIFGGTPVVALHADNAGALWLGTRGNGIFRIRWRNGEPDVTQFHHEPGNTRSLVNNFINAIYEDHAGAMWFGTEGGLALFDRRHETFFVREIKDGPSNKVIVGILEDDFGKLWCSHWNGITVIDPADSLKQSVRTFDVHDLVQGGFFYNNVGLKDSKGNLLFGGSNGFNVVHPAKVITNPIKPDVVVTDFRVNNRTVLPGELFEDRALLTAPVYDATSVSLRYFESNIVFQFAALDFAAPEKIRYAYKLDGFDKDWNYSQGGQCLATYTNLPEGEFFFRVKATNSDGLWNDAEKKIAVIVNPPWWKTTYAYVFYAIIGFSLLFAFRKMILLRANYRHEIKLERVRNDEMEKLNKAKLQFFTNISHEFRTPLTLILGPVQNLIDSNSGDVSARGQLHTIHNNAQRLLRLINQLLDFRKAESGKLQVRAGQGNLVKFVKEIKLSFDDLASRMNVKFQFKASSNVVSIYFDADHFEKILFNLLSNAFKYTPEEGLVSIEINENDNSVILSVMNTGRGIRKEHFDQIFQSFFSYEEEQHQSGTGIGLALVKSLVEAHHGKISVESIENERTTFVLELRKGKDHFSKSELLSANLDYERIEMYPEIFPEALEQGEEPDLTTRTTNEIPLEGRPKLLIVEDNDEVRLYIRSVFMRQYMVLEAENGKDGLECALGEIPDIIISDVMMPVMDGIAFCREVKSSIKTSHIPVILLTARTSMIFKVEGLETGADDYVIKPFNPKVLQLKVRNLLRTHDSLRKLFDAREVLVIEPRKMTLNSKDEKFLQKVLDSVERNMENADYSVDDMVEDVAMSRMQLYRKLKAVTGQSANEFVRTMRLKRAAQLLVQRQLTIAEITYAVGFNDLQYFREAFKKYFGVTPSEYQDRGEVDVSK